MTPPVTKPPAVPLVEPVRLALDDPEVRGDLLHHALSVLARWLGDRPAAARFDAATEAVQETQLRSLQKCNDYDSSLSVRAWLHGIMNNVLFETVRTIRRLPAQELEDSAAWEQLTANCTQHRDDAAFGQLDVADCLAKLPSEHLEIIQLRFKVGLKHSEIAARLGISTANARVRLCRAISAAQAIAGADPREDRP
jgi:RNA polymerase sigma factor (sigma-70 family)